MIGRRRGGLFRGHQRAAGIGLFLLALQVMRVGLDNIPPVTLATLAANTAIFLRILKVPRVRDICISSAAVWYEGDWARLFMAPWFHGSDMHLYFNMVSFLWKGISLEKRLGSKYFAYMIAAFCMLTGAVLVGLNFLAAEFFDNASYIHSCAVGFSGVLFAIKMVTTHYLPPGTQWVMGFIPVNSRFACWVELFLISILVPNASFAGHLAGILVGLAYVKGPLKGIMDTLMTPESISGAHPSHRPRNTGWGSRFFGGGRSGQRQGRAQPPYPQNGTPYYPNNTARRYNESLYTGGMSEDDQLQQALNDSLQTDGGPNHRPSSPPSYNQLYPDLPTNDQRMGNPPYPTDPPQQGSAYPPVAPSAPPPEPDMYNEQPPGYGFTDPYNRGPPSSGVLDHDELRRRRLARFDR
ncbi:rhomboid-related protein 4-like [Ptychodera flava]|uniref:rhomboid-related protein 4-like n=1 Tax=Ptychodera flava TaxID=63121 RepID=UPI00396A3E54